MADDPNATSDDMLNTILRQLLAPKQQSNTMTDISNVLGNAASGRMAGIGAENATALAGGALGNNLFQSAMQRDLAQKALPNFRAQQAVTGDQIANTQDVVPTGPANVMAHVVNYTGGRRPSNLGPNARAAGAALSNLGAQNIGKDVLPAAPTMPKLNDGGGILSNLLGGGSLATGLIGALAGKGPGGGGTFDLGKMLQLFKRGGGGGTTVTGDQGPDQFLPIGPDEQFGLPTDPSGGTGAGPGMADYYEWLKQQQEQTSGGGDGRDPFYDGYGE